MIHSRYMNDAVALKWAALTTAVLGLLDSLYLSASHVTGVSLVCGPLEGCNEVAASPYSLLFGIPLAFLGVLYYTGAFVLIAGLFSHDNPLVRKLLFILATVGVVMSLYFLYIQAFIIGAWCIYCVVSAAFSGVLWGCALPLFRERTRAGLVETA